MAEGAGAIMSEGDKMTKIDYEVIREFQQVIDEIKKDYPALWWIAGLLTKWNRVVKRAKKTARGICSNA
jgi:hypothetical protein